MTYIYVVIICVLCYYVCGYCIYDIIETLNEHHVMNPKKFFAAPNL